MEPISEETPEENTEPTEHTDLEAFLAERASDEDYEESPAEAEEVEAAAPTDEPEEVEEPTEAVEPETPEEKKRFSKLFNNLSDREQALVEREAQFKDKIERFESATKSWEDDPISFLKQQIAAFQGITDEEQIADAFRQYYRQLSAEIIGTDVNPEFKEETKYRKLERQMQQMQRQVEKEREQIKQEREEATYKYRMAEAQKELQRQLMEEKEQFPTLFSQQEHNPTQMVWEIISQDWNQQLDAGVEKPVALTPIEAAAKAEAWYADEAKKWASYLQPTDPENDNSTATTSATKAKRPTEKRTKKPRTLTNNSASVVPSRAPEEYSGFDEDAKEEFLRRMKL